ncbi:hypothetical protein IB211_00667 [Intestinimonas butyriciproducens]|uniref:Uncharacterized protein n=1 Tax=Intestinimonas butyriciproducens TaxID=1297617 RepID=A0A0S2W108_9FIRM|nr:hypothetical protein IB211_00667 [Intestinimonas butyriciproducens]
MAADLPAAFGVGEHVEICSVVHGGMYTSSFCVMVWRTAHKKRKH